jgi:prepilin-type N-terminal cleavage/methylation domain-containing protein
MSSRRGFSLVETMIALAILATGATAALVALSSATRDAAEGQLRQFRTALVDASASRFRLMDKALLAARVQPGEPLSFAAAAALPPGTAPWVTDPTPDSRADLSSGAFFTITGNGDIAPVTSVPKGTACGSAAQPAGTYCREVLVQRALPGKGRAAAGAEVVTVLIRLLKKGESPAAAPAPRAEVFVQ